ncbi:MAG: hypothetical protein M1358_20285 [Chloroflexi bacterium]|nr:hypothetical protein [Chloroflexota bacterium]
MASGQSASTTGVAGVSRHNLERRLARTVVSLVRGHQEAIQTHRGLIITLFVDRKTGEVRQSYILTERE